MTKNIASRNNLALCNFSVRTLKCFQILFFFAHKKLKKPPSKVAHNRPTPFIPQPSPTQSQQPKIDFSYHKNFSPSICSLVCGGKIIENLGFEYPLRKVKKFFVLFLIIFKFFIKNCKMVVSNHFLISIKTNIFNIIYLIFE